MQNLITYLQSNLIVFGQIDDERVLINSKIYRLLQKKDGVILSPSFSLLEKYDDCDFYIFFFGGKYYYTPIGTEKHPQLNILKYIGKSEYGFGLPFLGIHGKYELLNGSREYSDWCKKASFFNINTLGICEKNTLAGVLSFQLECLKNNIKPVIGATYTVKREDYRYNIKCFVKDEEGWNNILKINKEVKIVNESFIEEKVLLSLNKGLFIVFDPKYIDFKSIFPLDLSLSNVYYQLDSCEYVDGDRDEWYLKNIQKFLNSNFKPIILNDSFYLDKEDFYIKKKLNAISGVREYESENQYFKSFEQFYEEFSIIFKNIDRFDLLIQQALENTYYISSNCNFLINTKDRFLPKYKMNDDEKKNFKDNEELFWFLIEQGIKEKNIPDSKIDQYLERVQEEYEVLKEGDVIDYFLILWDIIKWCRENNILTGVGRGSAGGTLVGYLLDIHKLDPIKYDLLFSRFLNKGRIKSSLPDIDSDFPGLKRDSVKEYIEKRYGSEQVCSVGTYTTLQLRAAIKDLSKLENIPYGEVNYITTIIDLTENGDSFYELFENSVNKVSLKKYIQENIEIINTIPLCLGQPKSSSVHACAMVIAPEEKDIYNNFPIKWGEKNKKKILVSEWEGSDIEKAGYLKLDILGIEQLDKFQDIVNNIKEREKKIVDMYNLPLDDKKVYDLFQKGFNSDVFHFGAEGLSKYCKQLKPENIEELIAGIALYRPGAIENNYHSDFIIRKNNKDKVTYLEGTEEITKNTYGLIIYQEQVMSIFCEIANFTQVEADDIRRAMGKRDVNYLLKNEEIFIERGKLNGYEEKYLNELWDILLEYSKYSFNRSHSAAYAITGYICQWLKVHYPLYFWEVTFTYSKEEDIPVYVSEIYKTGNIKLSPPHINKSKEGFTVDHNTNEILWSLLSIKQCGQVSVNQIIEDVKISNYFSFEEFLSRNVKKGSKVTKQNIENLVLSGSFDEIENIKESKERLRLIEIYRKNFNIKVDVTKDLFTLNKDLLNENWWWQLQQKNVCGLAFFDYKELCDFYIDDDSFYLPVEDILENDESFVSGVKTGGYISECNIKETKYGQCCSITLESNYNIIDVFIRPDEWEHVSELFKQCEKKILLISGDISFYSRNSTNRIQTSKDSSISILS